MTVRLATLHDSLTVTKKKDTMSQPNGRGAPLLALHQYAQGTVQIINACVAGQGAQLCMQHRENTLCLLASNPAEPSFVTAAWQAACILAEEDGHEGLEQWLAFLHTHR